MSDLTERTFERAEGVLRDNSTRLGLRASRSYYQQIWARDSFISFLGSNALGDEKLQDCSRRTLHTLGRSRSALGQIADLYNPRTRGPEYGFSGATDSSTWFIIGLMSLYHATESKELLDEPLDAALDAFRWLRHQDANNTWLIDSPQGADWMDAAIQRTGKTLYNNILFVVATRCINKLCYASGRSLEGKYRLSEAKLRERFNQIFLPRRRESKKVESYWPTLARRIRRDPPAEHIGYYVHFVSFSRFDLHFDTLSNVLCALFGVADGKMSHSILAEVGSRKLSTPFPVRVLDPPYVEGEEGFDSDFNSKVPVQHRSDAYNYHNGAIWPFVGAFYVMALARLRDERASREFEKLAKANNVFQEGEDLGFNEWLNGRDGRPLGQVGQSWNAGTYIAAQLSMKGHDIFNYLA